MTLSSSEFRELRNFQDPLRKLVTDIVIVAGEPRLAFEGLVAVGALLGCTIHEIG
jgi:hypothetical protein